MIRPVDAPLGQGFGENPTSILPAGHWILNQFGNYQPDGHAGEDYPCAIGTPIRAVTSGRVLHVGFYGGTYRDNPYWIAPNFAGYCYVIDHGSFIGIYAHGMDNAARVTVGQSVPEGQVIGLSGNTGGSTGPHLHFEALPDGFVVNSYMYGRIDPATLHAGIAAMGTITTPDASGEDDFLMAMNEESQKALGHNAYLAVDSLGRVEKQNMAILETLAMILPAVARMDTRVAENVDVQGRIEKNQALMLDSQAAVEKLAAQKP